MIEPDRVLRPLREAGGAIDQLDTYESPAVLTEALRATWHAVERTLRTLLRSDATAPDSIRLTALSPEQMSTDAALLELRRRDLISLALAGQVHELRQAVARAEAGVVRAADADHARVVVRRLTAEVHTAASRDSQTEDGAVAAQQRAVPAPFSEAAPERAAGPAPERGAGPAAAASGRGRWRAEHRRPVAAAIGAAIILALAVAAVALFSGPSELEQGITAFGDGRPQAAEQHFRAALQDDPDNNTARLYLARILRREERRQEAAELLQAAAAADPEDAAVRRELGYLFLDLDRPDNAAEQFRRAVEMDAADPLNWAGMVHALREAGDTVGAAEWLRRAPASAREMMRIR